MIEVDIFTEFGLKIANGYVRIVHGGRGDYMEFTDEQLVKENIFVPVQCRFRFSSKKVYYNEYRTIDEGFVKIYHQRKPVAYADYKVGLWYVSTNNIVVGGLSNLLIEKGR